VKLNSRLKTAGRQSTSTLSRDLREYLVESGWTTEAASAVFVTYDELGGFAVEIKGQHKQAAETLEYGNERLRPTAAIRKYFNSKTNVEEHYQKALEAALGIKL